MIRRCADNRQTQRDIHAVVPIQRLERDKRLVVIHANRNIVAGASRLREHGIRRPRPGGVDASGAQGRNCRGDQGLLLGAQRAGFPGVRVQPGYREARRADAELIAQRRVRDDRGRDDAVGGELIQCLAQRNVDRDRDNAQRWRRQHHHRQPGIGKCRQELGMAGIAKAGVVECGFADRVGDDATHLAGQSEANGVFYRRNDRGGIGRIGMAGANFRGQLYAQHRNGVGINSAGFLDREYFPDRCDVQFGQTVRIIQGDKGAVPILQ